VLASVSTSAQSLQHTEAQARSALLDVTSYDVWLDLAADEATFGSVTTLTFESIGGPTFLDLKPTRVNAIRLNDRPVDADLLDRGRLPIDTIAGTNVLVVDAVTARDCTAASTRPTASTTSTACRSWTPRPRCSRASTSRT
jgi:aminopeptidase N